LCFITNGTVCSFYLCIGLPQRKWIPVSELGEETMIAEPRLPYAIIADQPNAWDRFASAVSSISTWMPDNPSEFIIAVSTAFTALFTLVLEIATIRLWNSTATLAGFAQVQARDMKDAIAAATNTSAAGALDSDQIVAINAQRQLRAYVFVKELSVRLRRRPDVVGAHAIIPGPVHTYNVTVILENGGQTPTRHMVTNISLRMFPEAPRLRRAPSLLRDPAPHPIPPRHAQGRAGGGKESRRRFWTYRHFVISGAMCQMRRGQTHMRLPCPAGEREHAVLVAAPGSNQPGPLR
jgi:hypothetical protein